MIIAQISDFHVARGANAPEQLGDTRVFLERAVAHLNRLDPQPDLVLGTGDLCHDGTAEDYALLRSILSDLAMPAYLIPGNHDDRAELRAAFSDAGYLPAEGDFLHYVLEGYPLRLIGLDTIVPGEDGGILCEERLAWVAARLAEAPERPSLIFMHHPPVETGQPLIDGMNCGNGEAFGRIVAAHPRIEAIVCGHVHRPIHMAWNGTSLITAPSTCRQFPLEMRPGVGITPVPEPPACRLYLWRPKAGLVAHLSYIPQEAA